MSIKAGKFEGLGVITLQPYDEGVNYTFTFEVEDPAGANNGAIPFGHMLLADPGGCSVTIRSHPEDVDYTTEIIGTVSNTNPAAADQIVTVPMSYPYTTQIRVLAAVGVTTIEVDSTTGMEERDRIGIRLDDDSIHWTTIAIDGVTDADTLEIVDAIPVGGPAAINNDVYVPRLVRGMYHLRLVCHFSGGITDKEFDFNRVYVRDV